MQYHTQRSAGPGRVSMLLLHSLSRWCLSRLSRLECCKTLWMSTSAWEKKTVGKHRHNSLAIVVVLWRLLHSWKFSCTTWFCPNCLLMVILQISCFKDPPLKHDGELSCMAAIWYAASNGNHLIISNGDFELSPNIWNTDWWSASWISECSCNLKKCSQVQLISEEMFSSTTIPLPSSCGCCWSRSQSMCFARVDSGASSHVWELDDYLCWR
jgi:hypothetical protein